MSSFQIDFFELSFLAEACIPPRPIARTYFWQQLTDKYWEQMTNNERERLFEWLNRNDYYKESLKDEEETQIFHARFDPDNQYLVTAKYNQNPEEQFKTFKMGDRYYIKRNHWVSEAHIISVEKI